MLTSTITLPTGVLSSMASLVAFAGTKDKFTPILDSVRFELTVRDGSDTADIVAYSTDRYRAARMTTVINIDNFETSDGTNVETATIPTSLLVSAAKAQGKSRHDVTMTIAREPGELSTIIISSDGWRVSGDEVGGNYPPIERLIPARDDYADILADTRLNASYLADIAKMRLPSDHGTSPAKIHVDRPVSFASAQRKGDLDGKRAPLIAYREELSDTYTVLLQPSVVRK